MGWNKEKCKWGEPKDFSDEEAKKAVTNADYSQAVYVNTSSKEGKTRQAYTYYRFGGYRICVVGHIHVGNGKAMPGNCFIPGWEDWNMKTPSGVVKAIDALKDGGAFPGGDRYPHKE